MGERTRALDWSATPLGEPAGWPQSLQTAIQIMLNSRYPMFIWWGGELINFYNDGYIPVLGKRHPEALGRAAREIWADIWDAVGPQAEAVMQRGEASWAEQMLLLMERNRFLEETYFTFSYSPLPDDHGGIGGVFCACTEDTRRVLGERRLRTLRTLAERTAQARSAEQACEMAAGALADNPHDLPFALLYLLSSDDRRLQLTARVGMDASHPAAPAELDPADAAAPWPVARVLESGQPLLVEDLPARLGALPGGAWPDSPRRAVVLPLTRAGQERLAGVAVVGLSPRLLFDDEYRGFLDLLAGHVATAVANARAYAEERRRAEMLTELDRAKTAFFSNVSHEFRTPLTLMLGPLEALLARDHEVPDQHRQLEMVHRNGLRLLRLVNTLLDFSRVEAGRIRAVFEPVDLAALTADLASNFRAACERAGLALAVDCSALPEPVFVDREMWEKIVLNLISNAFKFTLAGEIRVSLRAGGDHARLQVRDTGSGIPAEEMPRLFERFHRVENARGRTHEGSGIGLALVQELVRLHGGEVAAESEPGRGSCFSVRLPLGSAHLPREQLGKGHAWNTSGAAPFVEEALRWLPEAARADLDGVTDATGDPALPVAPAPGAAGRILVADDNADMRQYLTRLLAGTYTVETVADGEAALAAIRRQRPDLLLSDVMMPRLDGLGLLRTLRADPATRDLPALLLSARADEENRIQSLEANADDYLVKPFSARELLARVSAQIQMARLRDEMDTARRDSEARFRAMANAAPAMLWVTEPDASCSFISRGWSEYTGQPQTEALGFGWLERVHPGDRDRIRNVFLAANARQEPFALDHRVRRADGRYRWIIDTGRPHFDADGHFRGYVGLVLDVHERKQAEEALRRSESIFRRLAEADLVGVGFGDSRGHVSYVNDEMLRMMGRSRADFEAGRIDWVECIAPEYRAQAATIAGRLLRDGKVSDFESAFLRPDGGRTPYLGAGALVDGEEDFHVSIALDLTRIRAAEEARREGERLLQAIFQQMPAGVAIAEAPSGRLLFHNEEAMRLLGHPLIPVEDTAGYAKYGALHEDLTLFQPQEHPLARALGGEFVQQEELLYRRGDGNLITLLVNTAPVRDERGTTIRAVATFQDISELKRVQEALREADRRKDEFLATLAHELRNPLAPLRSGLELLKLAADDPATVDQAQAMMERQLTHMVRLIDDLLDVSRISRGRLTLRRQRVALTDVVNGTVETVRPLMVQAGHALAVSLPDEALMVDADATRLGQVFGNLLNNAAKFTEPGGQIQLAVNRRDTSALVTVRDNGVGIPPASLDTVFELFTQVDQSLEKTRGGLGIGLSLARRLVEMHGGEITAHSAGSGTGSEFRVRLPLAGPAPTAVETWHDQTVTSGARRLLVVDDNRDAADSLAMLLGALGHHVRTAHDGLEGLAVATEFRPEVVLLDLGMPRLNGYDTARRLRAESWGERLLLVALTGWGQDGDRRQSREAGFDMHLVKPVEPATLEKLLATLP